ncbi:MAG: NADH-quinone oxidoreductase subunit K [Myxococcales bacterium]
MSTIPLSWYLTLGAVLFAIGAVGVLTRRNALIIFMSVEIMLNAVNLTLVAFSRYRGDEGGQAIAFFVIAVAAAEAAVGLAIVLSVFRHKQTLNVDEIKALKH